MKEIDDSTGTIIPISEVKCIHGGLNSKAQCVNPGSPDPEGPYFFTFETFDGKLHSSKDYRNMEEAYAKRKDLELHVDQLNKAR